MFSSRLRLPSPLGIRKARNIGLIRGSIN